MWTRNEVIQANIQYDAGCCELVDVRHYTLHNCTHTDPKLPTKTVQLHTQILHPFLHNCTSTDPKLLNTIQNRRNTEPK